MGKGDSYHWCISGDEVDITAADCHFLKMKQKLSFPDKFKSS